MKRRNLLTALLFGVASLPFVKAETALDIFSKPKPELAEFDVMRLRTAFFADGERMPFWCWVRQAGFDGVQVGDYIRPVEQSSFFLGGDVFDHHRKILQITSDIDKGTNGVRGIGVLIVPEDSILVFGKGFPNFMPTSRANALPVLDAQAGFLRNSA